MSTLEEAVLDVEEDVSEDEPTDARAMLEKIKGRGGDSRRERDADDDGDMEIDDKEDPAKCTILACRSFFQLFHT
jgi:hypothetical protein